MRVLKSRYLIIASVLVLVQTLLGQQMFYHLLGQNEIPPFTWTGSAGDHNWNTAGNWSSGVVPGASDVAKFLGSACSGAACDATVNVSVSVAGLNVDSAYSGTITQGSGNTITIGTSGWTQAGGTFAGGDSAIAMNGNFALSGGTFTSTSATLNALANWVLTGGTFNHNSGTIKIGVSGTSTTQTLTHNSTTYYNFYFCGYASTLTMTGTMTVNGTLTVGDTFGAYYLNGGTVNAKGDVAFIDKGFNGTTLIKINGNANQAVSGISTARIPNFEIASTAGTVTFSGTLQFWNDFTYTSGSVVTTGTTFGFHQDSGTTGAISPGAMVFNHVSFWGYVGIYTLTGTMTVGGDLTVSDTYAGANSAARLNGGTISVAGNLTFSDYGLSGTTLIKVAGSSNQTVTGVSTALIPNFEIASTGGTVTFSGTLKFTGDYTYTSGTVDSQTIADVDLTWFDDALPAGANPDSSGGDSWTWVTSNPASFSGTSAHQSNIASGVHQHYFSSASGTMTVGTGKKVFAYVYLDPSNPPTEVMLQWNDGSGWEHRAYWGANAISWGTDGTNSRRYVGPLPTTGQWVRLEVAASSVGLDGATVSGMAFALNDGRATWDKPGATGLGVGPGSTVIFAGTGSHTVTPGTVVYHHVSFAGTNATYSLASGTMTVNGNLTLSDQGTSGTLSSGTLSVKGNVTANGVGYAGTALVKLAGTAAQTLTGTSGAFFPALEIASSNQTTFSGTIIVAGNYTFTSGTLDAGASTLQLWGTSVAPGSVSYNNVTFNGVSTVTTLNSQTMTVSGTLTISDNAASGQINSGSIVANGSVVFSNYGRAGTATLTMAGATNATLTIEASAAVFSGTITVNKSSTSAAISLVNNSVFNSSGQDLTVTQGILNMAGKDLTVNDVVTVSIGGTLLCAGGTLTKGSLVANGVVDCPGVGFNWTGLGGDSNWSNGANWSGGSVPGASNTATFGSQCNGAACNATVNTAANVGGIILLASYVGTITQASGVGMTVGNGGWVQLAGTFTGGNTGVTVKGPLTISAGTFTAPSAVLLIGRDSECVSETVLSINSSATFNTNSGTITIASTQVFSCSSTVSLDIPNGLTFNNLTIHPGYYNSSYHLPVQVLNGQTLAVVGTYAHNCGPLTGAVSLTGNLSIGGGCNGEGGIGYAPNEVITMSGTAAQTYSSVDGFGPLHLIIDKTGGSVTPAGGTTAMKVAKFTLTQGSFTAPSGKMRVGYKTGTSTVTTFSVANGTTFTTNGGTVSFSGSTAYNSSTTFYADFPNGFAFDNVEVDGIYFDWSYPSTVSPATGKTMTVNGSLKFISGYMGGAWDVKGDLISTCFPSCSGGSAAITLTGTGAQAVNIAGSGTLLPSGTFTINKSGGTTTLSTNVSLNASGQSMVVTSGNVDMNGKNLTINNSLSLNGNTVTKNAGVLTVNGSVAGTGSLFGGTVNP